MRIHVSLNVASLDRSLAFYTALLGQAASKLKPRYANFRLDQPPVHLALMEGAVPAGGGLSHLGIELPDAPTLQAWRERLEHAGLDFALEDQARCCYAQADKLWLTDPDGFRWEIWVRTGEYDAMGETAADAPQPASRSDQAPQSVSTSPGPGVCTSAACCSPR